VHGPPDSEGCADLYRNPGVLAFERLAKFAPLELPGVRITPVPLIHSKPTLGFCLEAGEARLAYLTDTTGLPPATLAFLKHFEPGVLVLDCTYPPQGEPPRNHNDLNLALALSAAVGAPRTYLTHVSHDLDAWLMAHGESLPGDIAIARDGKAVDIQL
jgi:phosphoribosyl 1,2-cyclic phosphate phosphodiesterase